MCSGSYATADDFTNFWGVPLCSESEGQLNNALLLSSSLIHAARAASGGCGCSLAAWAADNLKVLAVVIAAVMYKSDCHPNLSDEQRKMFLEWINEQLTSIRTGKLELCAGETGAEFPAIDVIEQSYTEFAAAQIIANRLRRSGW